MMNKFHFHTYVFSSFIIVLSLNTSLGLVQNGGEDPCKNAKANLDLGYWNKAKQEFQEILTNNPDENCALNGLDIADHAISIKSSVRFGDYESAWAELQDTIKVHPESNKLQEIVTEPWAIALFLKRIVTTYPGDLLPYVGVVLVLILFIIVVFFKKPYMLDIDVIDVSNVIEDQAGKDRFQNEIQTRFEQALNNIPSVRRFYNVDLIDQPLQEIQIPQTISTTPINRYLQIITDLLNKILINNVFTVKGILAKDQAGQEGIFVRLLRKNKLCGVGSVWKGDINHRLKSSIIDLDVYKELAEPASHLAYWMYCQKTGNQKRAEDELRCTFGTKSFRSYILEREATELRKEAPENRKVEIIYRKALKADPDNFVALLNLGNFILRENPEESVHLHRRVIELTKKHKGVMGLPHVLAQYRLGANFLESAKKDEENLDKALSKLHFALFDALKFKKRNPEITDEFIALIEIPYVDVLLRIYPETQDFSEDLRSRLINNDNERDNPKKYNKLLEKLIFWDQKRNWREPREILTAIESKNFTEPRVLYNLACYHSLRASLDRSIRKREIKKARRYLNLALLSDPSYKEKARKDPSFKILKDKSPEKFYHLIDLEPIVDYCI